MLEILQDYWKALLWSDGYHITGLAMTLWILILSVSLGGLFALVLAVGRNSEHFFYKMAYLAIYLCFSWNAIICTVINYLHGYIYIKFC